MDTLSLPGLVIKSQCPKPAIFILLRKRTMLVRFDSCILAGRCSFISLCVNSSGYKQKSFPGRDFRKISFHLSIFCFVTLILLIIWAKGFKFWANNSTWWRHAQNLFMHLCLAFADGLRYNRVCSDSRIVHL